MSEIRVDKIEPGLNGGNLTFTGITTFSSTGSLTIPVGTVDQRPSVIIPGQIRAIQGELTTVMEYYNGNKWVRV